MSFLVALPYVSQEARDECRAGMHADFAKHVYEIDNRHLNRGVAASWNIVAEEVCREGHDYLVCCSTSTRFGPQGGLDFALRLAAEEFLYGTLVVESAEPVGWHLIAWHRDLFDRVGFFDGNIHPAYGEDIDWSHRVIKWLADRGVKESWRKVPVDAWITMQGASVKLHGIDPRSDANFGYLERKWGDKWRRVFDHPFDDPANGLDYWPTPGQEEEAS